jgi:hypothetical protein
MKIKKPKDQNGLTKYLLDVWFSESITLKETLATSGEWFEALQRESQCFFLVTLSFAHCDIDHVGVPLLVRRELKRLHRWLERKFDIADNPYADARPVIIGIPSMQDQSGEHRPVNYRALLGVPLGKQRIKHLLKWFKSYVLHHSLFERVDFEPITAANAEQIAAAIAGMKETPEREFILLPTFRRNEAEMRGAPGISTWQPTAPLPTMEEMRTKFGWIVRDFGKVLRRGDSLQVIGFGVSPSIVLAMLPSTDVLERALKGGTLNRQNCTISVARPRSSDLPLTRITLVIPGVGMKTTMVGDPRAVLDDLKAAFDQLLREAEQRGPEAIINLAFRLAPLCHVESRIVCSKPSWVTNPDPDLRADLGRLRPKGTRRPGAKKSSFPVRRERRHRHPDDPNAGSRR